MRVCLFGAPLDTGNLGVAALGLSALRTMAAIDPAIETWVFDNGFGGLRSSALRIGSAHLLVHHYGAVLSRKPWRRENVQLMRLLGRLGGLGHKGIEGLRGADLALDVTGGDSFTDLYGRRVFQAGIARKLLCLEQGIPLVLLPQTYGPYNSKYSLAAARRVLARARMAWARDIDSYTRLQETLCGGFDPKVHRLGVDMAFGLPPVEPQRRLPPEVAGWLQTRDVPVVGVNINGLVYNMAHSRTYFGHRSPYSQTMAEFVQKLLRRDCRVVFVPHVAVGDDSVESDSRAARAILASLGLDRSERIALLPPIYDPSEAKWVIAQFDWFCGARMHACIAALSSCVPTACVAYSLKARGVFQSCGQEKSVFDLRGMASDDVVSGLLASFELRDTTRIMLRSRVPGVVEETTRQMSEILSCVR